MTRSLLRRLRDASHAFATGHSRRDATRIRDRRLRLLATRNVPRLAALEKAGAVLFPGSNALAGAVVNLGKRLDGPAHTILACELEIAAGDIQAARIGAQAGCDRFRGCAQSADAGGEVLPVRSAQFDNQLYAGLFERPADHFADDKLIFGARLGHLHLRLFRAHIEPALREVGK